MAKYTFVADHSYNLDTNVVNHTFTADNLYEVVENFQQFLRGAGFVFDGQLEIVDTPEIQPHSQHYYDSERNK